jgi:hypothetical protein
MFSLSFFLDKKRNKKIKSWNPRRSNWFLKAKRKELGLQPQTAFLFTLPSNL